MAVHFDGSTFLELASLACADGMSFSMSVWAANFSTTGGFNTNIFDSPGTTPATNGCSVGNGFDIFLSDLAGTNGSEYTQWLATGSYWHHYLFSIDCSTGTAVLLIDGCNQINMTANPWGAFPFTPAFSGQPLSIGKLNSTITVGDMDYLWIAPNVSLLSGGTIPPATVAKFRTAIGIEGKPADPSGYPAGAAVLLYGDAASFPTNRGSGGAFTLTGALGVPPNTPETQTFVRVRKTAIITNNLLVNPSQQIVLPVDWTAPESVIHAIGQGQSGHSANMGYGASGSDHGGAGADYAALNAPAFSPGDIFDVQIAATNAGTDGEAGADTWLKTTGGTTLLLARGGGSATGASVGDTISHGGAAVTPTGGDYPGGTMVNDVPYTVRPALFTIDTGTDTSPYPFTNTGGGGGGGAGGPDGNGADSGDLRPVYNYANNIAGARSYFYPPSGPALLPHGAAGGTANGGQVSGGTYSLAHDIRHADGNPVVPGDSGDPLTATPTGGMGDLGGITWVAAGGSGGYSVGQGAGGGGGPYTEGASPDQGHPGQDGAIWNDTDANPNLPSLIAGPGGGGGGGQHGTRVGAPDPNTSAYGGQGGQYGGGGGAGLVGLGQGGAGVIVLEYWTPGSTATYSRARIWGNWP